MIASRCETGESVERSAHRTVKTHLPVDSNVKFYHRPSVIAHFTRLATNTVLFICVCD